MTPSPSPDLPYRIGFGYDVHRFAPGRRLVLGGVEIPFAKGLEGHSDADVLVHALMDAILGAAGLPDIGHFFPNTDDHWKGADSRVMLREVRTRIEADSWRIGNLDATVVAEAPRVAPHIALMKDRLGADLGIDVSRLGIKATTNEAMGFVGREEGITAYAVALLVRS